MAGYSARQSTYTTGDTIDAADSNDEFDAILTAFNVSTGHTHDGSTAGDGGPISTLYSNSISFGTGADTDIAVTFNANSNDGVLTWMEDEDYFKLSDDLMMVDNESLIFGSDSDWSIKYDESGDDDLVLTGSDISIESSTSAKPVLQLLNTNADGNSATLKFNKNGASPATSDVIGNIDFVSEDAGNAVTTFGRIQSTITDVTAGGEEGNIAFYVAENDGTLTKGMEIKGIGSDGNIEVDISTHDGAAGGLKLGGTLVTSTATELNLLDGLNCTTAELNLLDGSAKSTSSITIGDTDAFIVIDGTTTTQIPASDIKTYVGGVTLTGSTDNTIVTVTGSNAIAGESTFTYDGSDLKILETTNDGSPSFTIGSADAESGKIQAVYDSGAQTLNYLEISTATADSGGDAGKIRFDVDGTDIFDIDDGGITFANGSAWEIGVAATTSTTAGRGLTITAGATSTNGNNINGGDLTLSSGGGDGTGTSKIDFKTKISGTDAPASKMQLSGAGVLTLSAGGVIIPDDGDIGSASATDAIQISSAGIVTFKDDILIKDGGTIGVASAADAMTVSSAGIVTFKDDILIKDGGTIGNASVADAMTVSSAGIVTFKDDIVLKDAATIGVTSSTSAISIASSGIVTFVDDIIIKDAGTIGSASDTDAMAISSGGVVNFTQSPTVSSAAVLVAGAQTIWVPAMAMRPTASNGCAAITDVETTSGRPDMQVLDFDASSDEHAQFQIGFPKSWNEGTITFRVFWTSTATDTDGCAWGLQGVSVANDATIDVAYGTAVVVTDNNISAAEDCLVTATSGNVTISNAAADTLTYFRIFRDVSDGNDDMAEDARLLGVQIFYTTDAANDA
jgi:hypothetical protein